MFRSRLPNFFFLRYFCRFTPVDFQHCKAFSFDESGEVKLPEEKLMANWSTCRNLTTKDWVPGPGAFAFANLFLLLFFLWVFFGCLLLLLCFACFSLLCLVWFVLLLGGW